MVSNGTDTMSFSCGILKVKVIENKREETAGLSWQCDFPYSALHVKVVRNSRQTRGKRLCCAVLLCCVAVLWSAVLCCCGGVCGAAR